MLDLLQASVAEGTRRIAVRGMGGVGKSTIAIALAQRLSKQWSRAQIVVNLRGSDDERRAPLSPTEIMRRVLHSFAPGITLPSDEDELRAHYLSALQDEDGNSILLLDDARDSGQVERVLPPGSCLLIVTSRFRIEIPGSKACDVDSLAQEDGERLLLQIAPRIDAHAARAAQTCGRLPLALVLFASMVNQRVAYTVAQLLERIETRVERLGRIDSIFEVSAELLASSLRQFWYSLAVFPGSFALPAAAAVGGVHPDAALEHLQTLVDVSLVGYDDEANRFRIHDLVQEYCFVKNEQGALRQAQGRHAEYFRDLLGRANTLLARKKAQTAYAMIADELASIEAGQRWASKTSYENTAAAHLCIDYVTFPEGAQILIARIEPTRLKRWFSDGLEAARRIGDRRAEAKALVNLSTALLSLGKLGEARPNAERGLTLARELGDERLLGIALSQMANVENLAGAYKKTLAMEEEWRDLVKDPEDIVYASRRLSSTLRVLGQFSRARAVLQEAWTFVEKTGEALQRAYILDAMGSLLHDEGKYGESSDCHQAALALIDDDADSMKITAPVLGNLGNALLAKGDAQAAHSCYQKQLEIHLEHHDLIGQSNALGNLGRSSAALGDGVAALEYYEEQIRLTRQLQYKRGLANALWNKGNLLDDLGSVQLGIECCEESLAIYVATSDHRATRFAGHLARMKAQAVENERAQT